MLILVNFLRGEVLIEGGDGVDGDFTCLYSLKKILPEYIYTTSN